MFDNSLGLDTKIKYIQKQFLCCVPIPNIDWKNIFDNFEWHYQEILINQTVNLEIVLKCPIKISYQKTFLKFAIKEFEKRNVEIHDCVYSVFGRLVGLTDSPQCFKHYPLEYEKIISLKESANIISEGTTGLCSWQASIALSEWCLTHKAYFYNKAVLELGSGVGLTGLTLALSCQIKKIYLTDCHTSVLNVLIDNVNRNIGNENTSKVEVLKLPWEDMCKDSYGSITPDVLIAADVIYDSSLFAGLLGAVTYFLNRGCDTEFILACTVRNQDTLDLFLKLLGEHNLNHQELNLPPQHNFIWSTASPIKIFCIKKNIFDRW